jgi:hypothetical protein
MNNPNITTWHVSRRVNLPVADAATVLDHLIERGDGRIDCQANAIALSTVLVGLASGVTSAPVRRLHGVLRVGGIVPMRVEVELAAWSRAESELGVRPMGRPPRAGRAERYFEGATALLTELVALVACDPAHREADGGLRRAS